jgi:hypothetical protein
MSPTPRTVKYAETLQAVEQRVVDALPEIIDALIARAKGGDLKAATYLADRILGRTAGARVAPADDRERPDDQAAFEPDRQEREEDSAWRSSAGTTISPRSSGVSVLPSTPHRFDVPVDPDAADDDYHPQPPSAVTGARTSGGADWRASGLGSDKIVRLGPSIISLFPMDFSRAPRVPARLRHR